MICFFGIEGRSPSSLRYSDSKACIGSRSEARTADPDGKQINRGEKARRRYKHRGISKPDAEGLLLTVDMSDR